MSEQKQELRVNTKVFPFNYRLQAQVHPQKKNKLPYGNQGIAVGLKWRKGFPVTRINQFRGGYHVMGHKKKTKRNQWFKQQRAKQVKAKLDKNNGRRRPGRRFVRDVIQSTVGYAPYEKRMMELIRLDNTKKALRFARKRLGSHHRAKRKQKMYAAVLADMQRKAALAKAGV